MKILIIEDDYTLNENISAALKSEMFHPISLYDGSLAERVLKKEHFDCVIMDVNLPGKSGFELCKQVRLYDTHTPIIMLTAFGELEDKVQGYNCGADDYLTKPFYMRELLLRVKALLKRNIKTEKNSEVISIEDIVINFKTKKVTRQGQEIILTPREFQVLAKLVKNSGELVSKTELIQDIWGTILDVNTNTIEVYINFLRNKVDKPFGKNSIKTKVGYGYYFEVENGD